MLGYISKDSQRERCFNPALFVFARKNKEPVSHNKTLPLTVS